MLIRLPQLKMRKSLETENCSFPNKFFEDIQKFKKILSMFRTLWLNIVYDF